MVGAHSPRKKKATNSLCVKSRQYERRISAGMTESGGRMIEIVHIVIQAFAASMAY